ncbi:hypothetical protein H1R20_g6453, partial [Candolleomyces eurysporus]
MDHRISVLEGSDGARVQTIITNQIESQYLQFPPQFALSDLLQPIPDASHKRNRKVSPPDSTFFPGTRKVVIKAILSWASSNVLLQRNHIFYLYGYAGSGKSAIAQAVCEQVGRGSRLLASFFFRLDAGDRSRIGRLPNTLASQVATALPETAPLIQAAMNSDSELASTHSRLALGARLEALVYEPFKTVIERSSLAPNTLSHPYLIVIDGLDECEDKEGVQEFLNCTLRFFEQQTLIPLRVLITSRIEQHIHSSLNSATGGVRLKDLGDHCSRDDIETFMRDVFDKCIEKDRVIQAYIREHGPWPDQSDADRLVDHIGGSFAFASTLFTFIFHGPGPQGAQSTPMSRLPLTFDIDPKFDSLYSATLARSEHLPHFLEVISTLALINDPLPVSGIAELLGLSTYQVVQVLLDLQAIIHLPETDNSDIPVMFCHASLRDFLTSQDRSGRFHASPAFHLRLFFQCFIIGLKERRQRPLQLVRETVAMAYSMQYEESHWTKGKHAFKGHAAGARIFKLCRKVQKRSPSSESHASYLDKLGITLLKMVNDTEDAFQVEGIVSLHREALSLRPSSNDARLATLDNLGIALCKLFENSGSTPAVDEAISLFRETRRLRPSPHANLSVSLNNLGIALYMLFQQSGCIENIVEAIGIHREALSLRSFPNPDRSFSLNNLGNALHALCEHQWSPLYAKEAIALYHEALTLQDRPSTLTNLGNALRHQGEHSGHVPDYDEAINLLQRALTLLEECPSIACRWTLMNIGVAFFSRSRTSGSAEDLDEAISSLRKSLDLIPQHHIYRHKALRYLVLSLQALYERDQSLASLEGAITHNRELLTRHYTSGHRHRGEWLDKLISLLRIHADASGCRDHLDEAMRLDVELRSLMIMSSGRPELSAVSPVSQA